MNMFKKILPQNKSVIGMIHFPPLIGYEGYPGFDFIKQRVMKEVMLLNNSGVHSIMIENNYDLPHSEFVPPEVTSMMAVLAKFVVEHTPLPVGIDVLWNDYKTALGICASSGVRYFRVPAFVDDVRTIYGDMHQVASEVLKYRSRLGLQDEVAILADVQVKHSEMIDKDKTLEQSVHEAVVSGADGIIVTGKWTGDSPKMNDLVTAKRFGKDVPVIVGSGSTKENLQQLFTVADSIIVGSAIMEHGVVEERKLNEYMESFS